MPDGSLFTFIGMFVCLAFSAFFSSSETAFTSLNKTKVKNMAQDGNKKAALVMKMVDNYDKLLSTLLVGNNIVNTLLTALATAWFIEWFQMAQIKLDASLISTLAVTVTVLIFGEITPKSLAKDHPEGVAFGVARFLRFLQIILTPVNCIFMGWKKFVNLIFKPAAKEAVTEGEVLTLVDEAHEGGSIDEYNKELIENIFEFDDMTAGEIATHRVDITMLDIDASVDEWSNIINDSRFSRYPVFEESVDNIIGVLDARAFFRIENKTRKNVTENAMTAPYFVPESVKADVLFRQMKREKQYFAIVLDEYGGVHGIITFTDLVECLVGEFDHTVENEEPEELITKLSENEWQISGSAELAEVEEAIGIKIDDDDSETFGGYVLGLYGIVPDDGSAFELSTETLDIKIESISEHKIDKAIVTLRTEPEEE